MFGVAVLVTLVLFGAMGAVAILTFGAPTVSAAPTATLTVFIGGVNLKKAGATTFAAAHSGATVGNGDTVSTGPAGKAAINYPDGSVTRLDSQATVTVSLARLHGASLGVTVRQQAGLTWNSVKKLVGAASFKVTGPNNSAATVRGTRFGFYIEKDPAGKTVVWVDVYDGVVAVSGATGPPVNGTANQRINVRAGAAPTPPAPIPATDFRLAFTVFNLTLEAARGKPVAVQGGVLSSGGRAGPFTVAADGKSDLDFVLGWPGSLFELTVVNPDGTTFGQPASTKEPIHVTASRAAQGAWTFSVHDVTSNPNEPWWVIVGQS